MFRPIQFLSLALLIALIGNVSAFVSYANAQLIDSIVIYYGESDDDLDVQVQSPHIRYLKRLDATCQHAGVKLREPWPLSVV